METTTRQPKAKPTADPSRTRPERVTVWCIQHYLDGDLHFQSFHLGKKDAERTQQLWNKDGRGNPAVPVSQGELTSDIFKLSVPASPQGIVAALTRVEEIRFGPLLTRRRPNAR